jgi:Protein of unknown function (DUF559)
LAAAQHGVVAWEQLRELGFSAEAIRHRINTGRLHPLMRGVYAVGRPEVSRRGQWMAAVLAYGPGAVLSHASAAAFWEIAPDRPGPIEVSVPTSGGKRHRHRPRTAAMGSAARVPGVRVHRRPGLRPADIVRRDGIPVTNPVLTLVDMASRTGGRRLERMINEADRLDIVDPEELRAGLEGYRGWRGVARLREVLDRRTFRLTRSGLEQLFLPLVAQVGLPVPLTGQWVNGFEVDFHWPDLGLVVETDGLRYHRTPAQQARDHLRDQTHQAAGLTPLRFTHAQVRYEQDHVRATLREVAQRLSEEGAA